MEISKTQSAQCFYGNRMKKSLGAAIIFLLSVFFAIDCNKNSTGSTVHNTPPIAVFNVIPENGSTQGYFIFDPSPCSDLEDSSANLEVRWDWENDAVWDTEYSTSQIFTHQYTVEGTKRIKLEIIDTGGLLDKSEAPAENQSV